MSNKNDDKMNKRKQNNCNGKNCHRNNKNNKNHENKNNQSDKKKSYQISKYTVHTVSIIFAHRQQLNLKAEKKMISMSGLSVTVIEVSKQKW